MEFELPDGSRKQLPDGATGADLAASIGADDSANFVCWMESGRESPHRTTASLIAQRWSSYSTDNDVSVTQGSVGADPSVQNQSGTASPTSSTRWTRAGG
jgi:hypothetical protein